MIGLYFASISFCFPAIASASASGLASIHLIPASA